MTAALRDRGYLAVNLTWERVGVPPTPRPKSEQLALDYLSWVEQRQVETASQPAAAPAPSWPHTVGFVDRLTYAAGKLVIMGWAVNVEGRVPTRLAVRLDGRERCIESLAYTERPKVKERHCLKTSQVGYRITVRLAPTDPLPTQLEVIDGSEETGAAHPLRMSRRAAQTLAKFAASRPR